MLLTLLLKYLQEKGLKEIKIVDKNKDRDYNLKNYVYLDISLL